MPAFTSHLSPYKFKIQVHFTRKHTQSKESERNMKNKWEKKRFKLENRFIYFSTVCHSLIALDIFAQFDSDDLFLRAVNMSVLFHLLYAAHPHRWSTSIFTDFYKSSRNFAPCPFSFAHLLSHSLVELLDIQILFYLALSHTCMHCQSIIYTIHAGTSSFAWNAHETSWISLSLSLLLIRTQRFMCIRQPASYWIQPLLLFNLWFYY